MFARFLGLLGADNGPHSQCELFQILAKYKKKCSLPLNFFPQCTNFLSKRPLPKFASKALVWINSSKKNQHCSNKVKDKSYWLFFLYWSCYMMAFIFPHWSDVTLHLHVTTPLSSRFVSRKFTCTVYTYFSENIELIKN